MTDFEKLQLRARKAIDFLENHPALGCGSLGLFNNLCFSIQRVCKHGYNDSVKHFGIDVRRYSRHYKKFKEQFDKEFKKFVKEYEKKYEKAGKNMQRVFEAEKSIFSIDVKYEKVYGEKWNFDHIEYWGELCFVVFDGDLKDTRQVYDQKNWQRFQGPEDGGRTFEEMIIIIAKEFKKIYGDFDGEDFLTEREKENHKKERSCYFVDNKDGITSTMKHNDKYIRVTDAQLNRRWLKWFMKTDYYKEHWKGSFTEILRPKKTKKKK